VARTAEQDKVRELQRTLYRAAKAEPGRRFHALYDKVLRRDVLERAWELVRANRGAPGIDSQTIADVEQYGIARLLDELIVDLRDGRYRPLPARRVFIPKPGRAKEQRPLSIPAVRDRVVQCAVKIVIEPIFEADFLPCSFGFRPKRSARDALQVLIDESWRGRRWVAESDVANCFEAIPHSALMSAVEERICDRHVLKLLRAMLRAGVMEAGTVRHGASGTPQGGVVSPVQCNVYLHRLDREWKTRGSGVLVRYADDLLALCKTKREAENAIAALTAILAEMGLDLKPAKTRIVHLREGGEGVDFLAFIIAGCAVAPHGPRTSRSSLAGPHGRRCSTPAIVCASSRRETGCAGRSSKSLETSTGSCEAGRVTSATATRPFSSTRSPDTRNAVSSCGSRQAINSPGITAAERSTPGRTATD
jgi:RNA-directed DNA polymerase